MKLLFAVELEKALEKDFIEFGIVIEKDYYYKDYCVKFEDGSEEWFEETDLEKI